jgi:hypothetical protein
MQCRAVESGFDKAAKILWKKCQQQIPRGLEETVSQPFAAALRLRFCSFERGLTPTPNIIPPLRGSVGRFSSGVVHRKTPLPVATQSLKARS